ncbi:MAG TPA: hypothetical protein VMN36_08385 [Verrucomicrobiales bacterium]|nr:hypothetical protein [Verrucomicrobiales bacterium]
MDGLHAFWEKGVENDASRFLSLSTFQEFALELLRGEEARSAATKARLALSDEASVNSAGEGPKPVGEPQHHTLPPLNFDPARYSIVAERFQEFANQIAGLRREEDGLAGEKTSAAFRMIFGYPLAGDGGSA